MQGEDLPYAGNRVDLDPAIKDARGFPVARVTYRPGRHELVASAHYGPRLAAILKEMGAQWTAVTSSPGTGNACSPRSRSPRAGTTWGRCGWAPTRPPRWSTRSGGSTAYDNVVVADSSVFVTSAGYGPTLTLAALAARAAHLLV